MYLYIFFQETRDFEPVDTMKPMDILADEELERLSGLLHRDNLVRGLGIVEHVYRLLHCTPGTMGIIKPEQRAINQTGGHSHTLVKIKKLYIFCVVIKYIASFASSV